MSLDAGCSSGRRHAMAALVVEVPESHDLYCEMAGSAS